MIQQVRLFHHFRLVSCYHRAELMGSIHHWQVTLAVGLIHTKATQNSVQYFNTVCDASSQIQSIKL